MIDYSEMPDGEINRLIAESKFNDIAFIGYDDDIAVFTDKEGVTRRFSYCNNPAYMWPIITEKRITIGAYTEGNEWFALHNSLDELLVNHQNPLRAAAVCALMIEDKNPLES